MMSFPKKVHFCFGKPNEDNGSLSSTECFVCTIYRTNSVVVVFVFYQGKRMKVKPKIALSTPCPCQ